MKQILFLPLACCMLAFAGCNNPERKAQKLITNQLQETLHDWRSYESVKFGPLDTVYTTAMDVPEYAAIYAKAFDLGEKMERAHEDMKRYESMGYLFDEEKRRAARELLKYSSELKEMQPRTDSINSVFVPEFKGWAMEHSFRANNLAGNKGISHKVYYFDKDLTMVVSSESL